MDVIVWNQLVCIETLVGLPTHTHTLWQRRVRTQISQHKRCDQRSCDSYTARLIDLNAQWVITRRTSHTWDEIERKTYIWFSSCDLQPHSLSFSLPMYMRARVFDVFEFGWTKRDQNTCRKHTAYNWNDEEKSPMSVIHSVLNMLSIRSLSITNRSRSISFVKRFQFTSRVGSYWRERRREWVTEWEWEREREKGIRNRIGCSVYLFCYYLSVNDISNFASTFQNSIAIPIRRILSTSGR